VELRYTAPVENRNRRPFGPVKNVRFVTEHCCQRFRERRECGGQLTEGAVVVAMEKWLEKSRELVTTPRQNLMEILNHARPAKFYRIGPKQLDYTRLVPGDWVMVVEGETLVTVYQYLKVKKGPPEPRKKNSGEGNRIREKLVRAGIIR